MSPHPRPSRSTFARVLAHPAAKWTMRLTVTLVGVAFAFSLVVIPVSDYVAQRSELDRKERAFEALADANEQLLNEVTQLETPEGAIAAARRQLGYVMPGEQRVALVPMPALPTTLPDAWPYSMVTDIVAVRTTEAGQSSPALAPLSP